jgi:hypothetical protein
VKGWPDMFPALIDAGRKEDIHVVWNTEGEIVGATVAALVPKGAKEGPMHKALAWPITLGPSGYSRSISSPMLTNEAPHAVSSLASELQLRLEVQGLEWLWWLRRRRV